MDSILTAFGLRSSNTILSIPNYGPHFLLFAFVWTSIISTARMQKKAVGLDNNVAPRESLARFGEDAVKSGKVTRSQLNKLKRNEAAHLNAHEAFPAFAAAVILAIVAKAPNEKINRAGLIWSSARVLYHFAYINGDKRPLSLVRGVFWWTGNIVCISLYWQSIKLLV